VNLPLAGMYQFTEHLVLLSMFKTATQHRKG
jgi:hypothetical protein